MSEADWEEDFDFGVESPALDVEGEAGEDDLEPTFSETSSDMASVEAARLAC